MLIIPSQTVMTVERQTHRDATRCRQPLAHTHTCASSSGVRFYATLRLCLSEGRGFRATRGTRYYVGMCTMCIFVVYIFLIKYMLRRLIACVFVCTGREHGGRHLYQWMRTIVWPSRKMQMQRGSFWDDNKLTVGTWTTTTTGSVYALWLY